MTVIIRERAEADLADIWRFTAGRWSVAQADKYYRDIVQAIAAIGDRPELGKVCDDIRAGYRRHSVASHVIFYRIDVGTIDVVRVLHARRDFKRHLPTS